MDKILINITENSAYMLIDTLPENKIKVKGVGEGLPIRVMSRGEFIEINDFLRGSVSKKFQESNSKRSGMNQERISNSSEKNQVDFIIESNTDQVIYRNNSTDNQLDINQDSEAYLKRINDFIAKFIKAVPAKNILFINKLNSYQTAALNAASNNNVKDLKEITKQLKSLKNKLERQKIQALKARELKAPAESYKQIIENNKDLVKLLLDKKFIRKATDKRYNGFNSLPDNAPNSIQPYLKSINFTDTKNEYYTTKRITRVMNAIRDYSKHKKFINKVKFRLVISALLLGTFGYLLINRPADSIPKNKEIVTADSAKMVKYLRLYKEEYKVELSAWRDSVIINRLKNKPVADMAGAIDSINNIFNK